MYLEDGRINKALFRARLSKRLPCGSVWSIRRWHLAELPEEPL